MKNRWRKLAVCMLPLLAGGCWFEAGVPVRYYDLAPVALQDCREGLPVSISEFENFSPSGTRIMVRYADGVMRETPNAKWVQNPGELVTRRLIGGMSGAEAAGDTSHSIHVRGRITEFTVSHADRTFELDGFYVLQAADNKEFRRNFRIRAPLAEDTETGWVQAASAAVAELAEMLNADLSAPEVR